MKILLLTDNYIPQGGAENCFFKLEERLKKKEGVQVYTIAFGHRYTKKNNLYLFPESRSNAAKLIWRILPNPVVYYKIRRFIKAFQPDIVHLHNLKQHTAAVLKALHGQKVIHSTHDFSLLCPTAQNIHMTGEVCKTGIKTNCFWQHRVKFSKLVFLLVALVFFKTRKKMRKLAAAYIAPSPILANYLRANHFNNVHTIAPFHNEAVPCSFDRMDTAHFLFAAHLGKHKGTDLLLHEFAAALQKNPKLILHIAGSGPEEKNMRALTKKLGMTKQVYFHGWQNDLRPLYEKCAALLFPSIGMESYGLVMTEAMGNARAVIAANRSTGAWLIEENKNGLLFDPLIKSELAKKILLLAENRSLTEQLGSQGYQSYVSFVDNEKAFSDTFALYLNLGGEKEKKGVNTLLF